MACGSCGSKKSSAAKPVSFTATFPDGTKKTYSSEIEAQLATARKGGTYRRT